MHSLRPFMTNLQSSRNQDDEHHQAKTNNLSIPSTIYFFFSTSFNFMKSPFSADGSASSFLNSMNSKPRISQYK